MMDERDGLTGIVADTEAAERQAIGLVGRVGAASTRALAVAGITVTAMFLVSRILGYVRVIVFAAAFPQPDLQLAPFYAAFRIPDLMFQLVAAGALGSALIPVIAGLFAKGEDAHAWRVVSTVSTLMIAALVLLAGVVLLLAPGLVALITPGFSGAQLEETVELTRIMMLSPIFLAAGAVATSILNARGRFAAAAAAPLVYNAAIIAGTLILVPAMGTAGLAWSVVLGSIGHVLVQVPSVARLGARIRPRIDLRDMQARLALLLMVPRAIGLGATQIVFVVMTSLATTVSAQSVTYFNFGFTLLQIPIGVIGVPLGIVLLPSLSREAATGGMAAFSRLVTRGLALLAYVMFATAALGIVTSPDIVRILFHPTNLTQEAFDATAAVLAVFMLGLAAHSLIAVLARGFYALKDTRTPVAAALVAVVSNILIATWLVVPLGLNGLALAIAMSAWLEASLLTVLLLRRVPAMAPGMRHVGLVMAKSLLVTGAGGIAAWGAYQLLVDAWGVDPGFLVLVARTLVVVAIGGAVMVAGSLALRIDELRTIVGVVADLIRRRGRA
jgi:putative peptidoglycan lipid II flippase